MKELDIKARQAPEPSSNGDSIPAVQTGENTVQIPKELVPRYFVGDDIDNWFKAYEVALAMHRVSMEDWGLVCVNTFPPLEGILY